MQKLRLLTTFLIAILPVSVWAQLNTYTLERNAKKTIRSDTRSARINAVTPLSLPFWDDFSFTPLEDQSHPLDSLWIKKRSVLVSNGQAINPPSINVATFDGLDSTGIAYSPNPTDVLAFGYRDTLESQPIKLTEVLLANRGSVFLSFSYQAGGNGEPPDPIDFLRMEFLKSDGDWQSIVTLTVEDASDPTAFYDTLIQITDNIFYHDDFRFRFVSFGRKSGRFDAWHVDYVYLNKGRSATDNSFPDRSINSSLSAAFDDYYSIPVRHFFSSSSTTSQSFGIANLDSVAQSSNYQFTATVQSFKDYILLSENIMQVSDTILPTLKAFEHRAVQLDTFPAILNFDLTADSVSLQYKVNFSSGDTIESSHGNIDFRVNNKLGFTYILSNYYAYDDGLAEYSAGLVDPGNELAYRFDMKTNSQDTINGVFINFPAFTGTSANSLDFFILDDNDGKPGNILYEQSIDIVLNAGNEFKLNTLFEGVIVQNAFYIGYREPSTGSVQIGLDKSNDTGNQMYYRLTENGQWQLNDRVTGSLMIRPRFGIAPVVTSVYESQHPVSIYPNPNRGEFYVKGPIEQLRVISITGQPVNTAIEDVGDNKRVNVTTAATGLYIVQYKSGSKVFTEKIFITK